VRAILTELKSNSGTIYAECVTQILNAEGCLP